MIIENLIKRLLFLMIVLNILASVSIISNQYYIADLIDNIKCLL